MKCVTSEKCIFIHKIILLMIFFDCFFLLYSIFSISFSQESQFMIFFHLLRIRYLIGRSQYVDLDHTKSDINEVHGGIPQGSVMGHSFSISLLMIL